MLSILRIWEFTKTTPTVAPGARASSDSRGCREKLPGQVDDVVEVTSSGSLESGQPKREGRSKSQGRTVVAQNGTSITGTSVKSKSSQGPSTSGERRRSPRPPANDAELSDPIDGVRGSSSEAAARTAPAQLRSWLERAHQEANALYTSGALNGFRSGVELRLKPCMNHC